MKKTLTGIMLILILWQISAAKEKENPTRVYTATFEPVERDTVYNRIEKVEA